MRMREWASGHSSKLLKLAKSVAFAVESSFCWKNIIIYNTIMKQSPYASVKWLCFGPNNIISSERRTNVYGTFSVFGEARGHHRWNTKSFYIQQKCAFEFILWMFSYIFWWSMMTLTFTRIAFLLIILSTFAYAQFWPISTKIVQ